MMDLTTNINELLIWSENPRHSDEIEDINISENEIINILINIVGHEYMYNLAKDILEKGLMGSTRPVVVREESGLLVYDGNRRISSIKFLLNPNIINDDNVVLRNKINQLLNSTVAVEELKNRLKNVKVYETNEEEAYEIMDKTHGGVRDGVGTLPWDAYQKDKSNNKRGVPTIYPSAFKVVTKLKLRKNDIKDEYTSFDRIFGNVRFKELFQIVDYIQIDQNYLRHIYDLLQRYKREIKNDQGFSRIFNKATEESEIFYEWANPQINPEANYKISFINSFISIYQGQELPCNSQNYNIRNFDGTQIQVNQNQIEIKYIDPAGVEHLQFNNNITGIWKYKVKYLQSENELAIRVKELADPVLTLKQNRVIIHQNEAITNLRDYIHISTNSIDEDVKNHVTIESDTANINNYCFLSSNNIGQYYITYKYTDARNRKEATAILSVDVISATQVQAIEVVADNDVKLLTFDGPDSFRQYFNRLGYKLRALISQINKLNISEYLYVLASSLRVVVHLLDEEYNIKNSSTPSDDLPKQLSTLIKAITNDVSNNHVIFSKENSINETNLLTSFRALNGNKQWLIDTLNCGSHSGGSSLSEMDVKSAGKQISRILTYIAILLH